VGNKCFSMCLPGNTGDSFQDFSAKVRESVFQTHGCHERKTPHRERDGEREDRIEHKSSGVRQPLNCINYYIFNYICNFIYT
jgi:hypothetical protein